MIMTKEDTKELFYLTGTNQLVQAEQSSGGDFKIKIGSTVPDDSIPRISLDRLEIKNDEVYVVDSIKAGIERSEQEFGIYNGILRPIFELLKIKHEHLITETSTSIKEFGESLKGSTKQKTVIFISGDTSISEFVNSLTKASSSSMLKLFVIPAGTGNSLALSIGNNGVLDSIAKLFTHSTKDVHPLYLYEVEFPLGSYFLSQSEKTQEITKPYKFLVVFSWCFHASLVSDSDTPELRKNGIERFKMAAFSNLAQEQRYDGTVKVGSKKFEGPFAYLVITLSQRFEPTFEILPKGNIFEDSLYLVSFKTEETETAEQDPLVKGKYIMDIMGEVYNKGKHIENDKVIYEKIEEGQNIEILIKNAKEERKRRFCLDGSIILLPEEEENKIVVRPTGDTHNNFKLRIIS